MRWSQPRVPDIKGVIDRFQLYDRILQRNVALIQNFGTPCTYWRNTSITPTGGSPTNATKCYCWSDPTDGGGTSGNQTIQPDRFHFLCGGTGYIDVNNEGGGYQKYGYREHIISTPSTLTLSPGVVITGNRNSCYGLSGGELNGTITTEMISFSLFKDVDYILFNDVTDPNINRVDYFYSTDGSNWTQFTTTAYTTTLLANKQATLTLPSNATQIQFRIVLRKRTADVPSPKWNSIRFRYRQLLTLAEIDPRFSTATYPAFLASREQQQMLVEGSAEHGGWVTKFPLKFWILPDATVENADIIKFLTGTYANMLFSTADVIKYTYGNSAQILHRGFKAEFIRDDHDVLKIANYLI